MTSFSRQWPKPQQGSSEYYYEQNVTYRHRVLGISLRTVTSILAFVGFWNLLLLSLGITISASQGRRRWEGSEEGREGGYEYADSYHRIYESDVKAGIVFLWCTPSFVALVISIWILVRRNSMTVRLAAFSAGAGTAIYVFAFGLWHTCAYSSPNESALYPVCQHDPDAKWFSEKWMNPLAIIWVLPWFGLVAAIMYLASTILALFALRRQHKERKAANTATAAEHRKSASLFEIGMPSKEYAEMGTRSIQEMETDPFEDETLTLPSRTMSTRLSRQISLGGHSTSPPTYRASNDESVLKSQANDEKRETV